MEGKTLILSVFVMSLFMANIQVDAAKCCCPDVRARNRYNVCRLPRTYSQEKCADICGCILQDSRRCPSNNPYNILENKGNDATEYCNVGCVSSVCGALTSLHNSDASEIVKGAVEKCADACSTICTKGSTNAVETA